MKKCENKSVRNEKVRNLLLRIWRELIPLFLIFLIGNSSTNTQVKNSELGVVLRSPFGDTDLTVLAIVLINDRNRLLYDYGNGDNQKKF